VGRTTIARDLIELIKLGKADKDEILRNLAEASGGAERLRKGKPAVTVRFHALRDVKPGKHARGTMSLAEDAAEPVYDELISAPLFALTDDDRVDVLRFGRHPDQDVQILDSQVSREHGLVIFADSLPLYCDYGTLHGGVHTGSTNGTYLDGVIRIRDAMINWLPGQALMLGIGFPRKGGQVLHIKVTYELHAAQSTTVN
jgi:hypothetical protein